MDDLTLHNRIQDLTDLELAVLLSLVAEHHCIIEARDDSLEDVSAELSLIVSEVFKLSYVVLQREDVQSIDRFGDAILDERSEGLDEASNSSMTNLENGANLHSKLVNINFRPINSDHHCPQKLDSRRLVNVIIAKDFNLAHEDVQIQALELIRKRRIYSRTTVHTAPKVFLILPLIASSSRHIRLTKHLNDRIFMSHHHEHEDGFPNLEGLNTHSEDQVSVSSVAQSLNVRHLDPLVDRRIDAKTIELLRSLGQAATITPEIRRYLQDIVVFLRIERGVDGGVSPYATTLLLALAKYLAPFHGMHYVTPSLVALAAKKVYAHRIIMATPTRERSTQYGTDIDSAADMLKDLDPKRIIDNVLNAVACPT